MSRKSDVWLRRVFVVCGYLFCFVAAVRSLLLGRQEVVDLWISVAMGVVVVGFCAADARVRGGVFLRSFQWLMFFTWPVGLPVYLLWTRGVWRGLLAILLAFMGVVAVALAAWGIAWGIWRVWG